VVTWATAVAANIVAPTTTSETSLKKELTCMYLLLQT
jgi:hypothetical protein